MAKYKINKELNKSTIKYIQSVIKKLENTENEIDETWFASLDLICQFHNTITECQQTIKTDGLMIYNRFGDRVAHPLIKVQENASIQLQKLLIEFLLTKKSELKNTDVESVEDDSPLMSFMKNNNKEKR